MHVWVIEGKYKKDDKWEVVNIFYSRSDARYSSYYLSNYYKTRVVKYISTKGE